jgi:interferon gamma-inducible protein 30
MVNKIYFILLSLLVANISSKPLIEIYVESLCPDCMQFFETSFTNYIAQGDHNDLADVVVYPFGNAKEDKKGEIYAFTCQHGPNECYGNSYYACANYFLPQKTNPDAAFKFITCMEKNVISHGRNFDFTAYHCLEGQSQILSTITQCVKDTNVSNPIMHEIAQKTINLNPPHKYVPWITIDGKHDTEIENKLIDNMYEYLKSIKTSNSGELKFLS